MSTYQQLQVRRDQFAKSRVVSGAPVALEEGEVRVAVESFAVTANNVTYAAAGDQIGYWQFFPPRPGDDGSSDGWGVVPMWGFAEVTESRAEGLKVGERLFGYFPPASELVMTAKRVRDQDFVDGAAHRAELPSGYNSYRRLAAEPGYDRTRDNFRMLLWPLHMTSFCLWDALSYNDWYGAEQVVLLSASSKTSIGLAYGLDRDENAPAVVGVTSSGNKDFVESLGAYSQVLTYDDLSSLESKPTAIVDMSGNQAVLAQLHQQLGDTMRKTVNVGLTHWQQASLTPAQGIITERSEFFFAPSHIQMRIKEWGPEGFGQKTTEFLTYAATRSAEWLEIERVDGLGGLDAIFADVCEGKIGPRKGLIVEV